MVGAALAFLVSAYAGGWSQSSSPAPEFLTLDRALDLAAQGNRLLRSSRLEEQKAADRLAAARTGRLPAFSVEVYESKLLAPLEFRFERGAFGVFPGTGPVPGENTTISSGNDFNTLARASVTQPLFQLHRIGLGIRLQELDLDVVREQARSQLQAMAADVKRGYYGIVQTESALASKEESVKFYRELEELTGRYVEQQTALAPDRLEVQARRAKEEYDVLVLRHLLDTQKEQLNSLLGRDILTPFSVAGPPEPVSEELDIETARRRALEGRPEARQARLRLSQAEADRRLKRSESIPGLSLMLNYIRLFREQVLPAEISSAGLLFTWEPFDWGRKRRQLAEKTRAVEQASNGVGETESGILIDVGNRFRKLEESRELLKVTEVAQQAARERLRVTKDRYEQQASLLKDLLQAQAALSEANDQHQQSLLSFWTARAEFEKSLGEGQ